MKTKGQRFSLQLGLTIVELLVALALGLFLVGGIIQLLVNSGQAYRSVEAGSNVQENARFSLMAIARDIRMAGFMGCGTLGGGVDASYLADGFSSAADHNMVGEPVALLGYENGADNANSNAAWDAFFLAKFPESDISRVAGTDVVQYLYAGGGGSRLDAPMSASTDALEFPEDGNLDGLEEDKLAVITDCVTAVVFSAAADDGDDVDVLEHDGLGKVFDEGSRVFLLAAGAYFIGTSAAANNPCTAETPCLYSLSLGTGAPAQALVVGVEDFEVTFGEDTNNDGVVDAYDSADGIADWTKVYSVRLGLLLSSEELVTTEVQSHVFEEPSDGDQNLTQTGDDDRRFKAPYWTTIALRNALP